MSCPSKLYPTLGDAAVRLYESGLPSMAVAKSLGVSRPTIIRWLGWRGIKLKGKRDYGNTPISSYESRVIRAESADDCWGWNGPSKAGYGLCHFDGGARYAHRVSWLIHTGKEPGRKFVCHHCDNPPCTNPRHLFLGTGADNMDDAAKKGRLAKKLTMAEASEIKVLLARGHSQAKLAKRFNVSPAAIQAIADKRSWKHA